MPACWGLDHTITLSKVHMTIEFQRSFFQHNLSVKLGLRLVRKPHSPLCILRSIQAFLMKILGVKISSSHQGVRNSITKTHWIQPILWTGFLKSAETPHVHAYISWESVVFIMGSEHHKQISGSLQWVVVWRVENYLTEPHLVSASEEPVGGSFSLFDQVY